MNGRCWERDGFEGRDPSSSFSSSLSVYKSMRHVMLWVWSFVFLWCWRYQRKSCMVMFSIFFFPISADNLPWNIYWHEDMTRYEFS